MILCMNQISAVPFGGLEANLAELRKDNSEFTRLGLRKPLDHIHRREERSYSCFEHAANGAFEAFLRPTT